jgi:hypothetical protein
MDARTQLQQLEERQLELLSVMSESDAHAAKCAKLGKKFATAYPEDYAAYIAANEEYNANEAKIAEAKLAIEAEEIENLRHIEEE